MSTEMMSNMLAEYFKTKPVLKAWLFGSFARGEETSQSDVDILIVLDHSQTVGMDFFGMYEELKDHRVTFISMNEQFDTSTAIGEAMLKIILIFAELERNMTGCRSRWLTARLPRTLGRIDDKPFPPDDALVGGILEKVPI